MTYEIAIFGSDTWPNAGTVAQAFLQAWVDAGRPMPVALHVDHTAPGEFAMKAFAGDKAGFNLIIRPSGDLHRMIASVPPDVVIILLVQGDREIGKLAKKITKQRSRRGLRTITYHYQEARVASKSYPRHRKEKK